MHREAYQFVADQVAELTMEGRAVLELGSYNVNGSVRPLFAGCARYVGLDLRPGRDVDVVSAAADYDGAGAFAVVVCCEMLEHDPDPPATLASAWRALQPGGMLILTAASPLRAPHGCDGGQVGPAEHYAGIGAVQLSQWLEGWSDVQIMHTPSRGDLYATARKRGD